MGPGVPLVATMVPLLVLKETSLEVEDLQGAMEGLPCKGVALGAIDLQVLGETMGEHPNEDLKPTSSRKRMRTP